MIQKYKALKMALVLICTAGVVCIGGFFLWANTYYHAQDIAVAAMQEDSTIEVVDNFTILSPQQPSDIGIIFYPGAKVEGIAYLPLLEKLKNKGYTCVLVEMPLRLAILSPNAADAVFDTLPNVQHWYIAGHSMGGAMASSYAAKHADKVEGLILLGAYIYGEYPPEKALTIYGTYNDDLEKHITYTQNIVKIEGGNHAQFGNYGPQKGDREATISAQEQQSIAVDAIHAFIKSVT